MAARSPLVRRVLVAHGDPAVTEGLATVLSEAGHEIAIVTSAEAARRELAARPVELVIADAALAIQLLPQSVSAVIVTSSDEGSLALAMAALDAGCYGHLTVPVRLAELRAILRACDDRERRKAELARLRQSQGEREAARRDRAAARAVASGAAPRVIARSPRMLAMLRDVQRYAEHKTTVLVHGESGTGKELIARAP